MSVYNQHGDSASIDKVSFAFLRSYIDHMSLLATIFRANACMNVLSAVFCHLEVIISTP
jgi:hypothetical protein